MRARDAENLIAQALMKGSLGTDSENQISESVLLGLRRSSPIYVRKIQEKKDIKQRHRHFYSRRIISGFAYPVRALLRIFKS